MRPCVNCGHEPLIQNPVVSHWRHCPVCDPLWAEYSERLSRLFSLERMATVFAADSRGNPTRGGSKS